MTDSSVLANGQMQSITARLDIPQERHYLRLHFFEEYNVPIHLMSKVAKYDSRCATVQNSMQMA
jgi:hypothetical protein